MGPFVISFNFKVIDGDQFVAIFQTALSCPVLSILLILYYVVLLLLIVLFHSDEQDTRSLQKAEAFTAWDAKVECSQCDFVIMEWYALFGQRCSQIVRLF